MCGRYQLEYKPKQFDKEFEIKGSYDREKIRTSYNVKPSWTLPVVVSHSPNTVDFMKWAYAIIWEREKPSPRLNINIKAESCGKGWMKEDIQFHRCVVPASGFYEPKGDKSIKNRDQYYFHLKNKDYLGFAGVFCEYKDRNGHNIKAFAIITTTPNKVVGKVHDRMPVILDKEAMNFWLNPDNVEIDQLIKLLVPYPDKEMEGWQVSNKVKQRDSDGPDLIQPIDK